MKPSTIPFLHFFKNNPTKPIAGIAQHILLVAVFFLSLFSFTLEVTAQNYAPHLSIPFRKGNVWGYCDTLGEKLMSARYDSVGFFEKSDSRYALFRKGQKWGVLDSNYREAVAARYASIELQELEEGNFMVVGEKGKKGLYTLANRELTPILYDSIVLEYLACGYIVVVDQHKQGVYTAGGKKLSDAIYDRCFMLDAPSEGKNFILVPVKRQYDCQMIGQLGNTYVKIRQDGSTRPFPADSIPEKENWNLLESSDASTFYRRDIEDMIRRGKINASYTKIHLDQLVDNDYSGGYYRILIENPAGLALYDLQLNKVVSEYYEDLVKVVRFRNGQELRFVKKKGKYGVVSAAGTQVYPFEYDGFGTISSSEAITIKKGGKGAIVFSTIYPPISCRYEEIEHFKNLPVNSRWSFALFKVVKAGKPGFVGENGVEYFK